jgi:hypothetical protein
MTPPRTPGRVMTPERWRSIDHILQGALVCAPDRRKAFVSDACGADAELKSEVVSLLAAHDAASNDFLERPAMEELGLAAIPSEPSPADGLPPNPRGVARSSTGRFVAARWVVYAATAGIAVGMLAGWSFSRSSIVARWMGASQTIGASETSPPHVDASAVVGEADGTLSLAVVDRSGHPTRTVPATRPWTPRFSPDGRFLAYGAFGDGRNSSDIWITDLETGTTRRLTDDDSDNNDPQWSPDGRMLAYSANAPDGKDVVEQPAGGGDVRVLAARPGTQFPSDWLRDGSALLVTEQASGGRYDVIVQPADGSPARPYAATPAQESAARISRDGRWLAYISDESGREEVYIDSYPKPGHRVMVSRDGGVDPAWRANGRELYYWRGDALVAVRVDAPADAEAPRIRDETILFHAPHEHSLNTMYDVSPNGDRFVIVRHR